MASKIVRLTVVFESAKEGGFIARVPSLPGCETQGETLEEAEEMVKDAIKAYCASRGNSSASSAVPVHAREMKRGLLLSLIKQAGLTPEAFQAL